MRLRLLLIPLFSTLLALSSCGDDSGGGPPTNTGGAGGDIGPDEEPAPQPGVCRALCCSSGDCSTGESCTTFNASWGTLGYCSGTGWGSDGGVTDGGTTFPADCFTADTPLCNPLTNEGCAGGDACDLGGDDDPEFVPYVDCLAGDNTQGAGETCDAVAGPFCQPGLHCVPN
jgi:hypothetical protein